MNAFDVLQLIGGTILALAWLPQLIKILKTKSSHDISSLTVIAVTTGVILGEIWAFSSISSRWAYLLTHVLALLILIAVLISVFTFRKGKHEDI